MNELALFAGAGGGLLASRLLGWKTVCAVEIDDYARRVLVARQDDGCLEPFPIWDDVRSFDGRPWRGLVDVVTGGFPCQAFSTASHGRRVAYDLWPEMRRIVGEVAPQYVFAENVSRAAILAAARDLAGMGYTSRVLPLSAEDLGADHVRRRYWLRAHADDEGELRSREHAEVALLPGVRPGVWSAFDGEPGVVDGLADRVDRLRAIGNGQVPAVAALAWETLST